MTDYGKSYDLKYLKRCLFWMVGLLLGMKFLGGIAFMLAVPMMLSAYSRGRHEGLLFWLLLTTSMLICNGYFAPLDSVFMFCQRGLLMMFCFLVTLKVFGTHKHPAIAPFGWMMLYVLYMSLTSAGGFNPMISYLKLILFTFIYFAFYGIAVQVSNARNVNQRKIRSVMLTFAIIFIFGSIAILPYPGIGQMSGEAYRLNPNTISMFQGMTRQPQCLGPIVSILSVVIFADMLFGVRKVEKLHLALLLCCPILLYKTSSRTGMISYLVGMAYTGYLFMRARGINGKWKSRIINGMMGIVMLLTLVVLSSPGFTTGARRFILKSQYDEEKELTKENFMSSRQQLIDMSMENFHEKPLFGNGFQVMRHMEGADLSNVLSAPIEKGFWPAAILEEGGVIGFIIFVGIIGACLLTTAKNGAYMASSALFVYVMCNFGEFTFFSLSYVGGFAWAFIFGALAIDVQRMRAQAIFGRYGM